MRFRVILLVLVPLVFLVGIFGYSIATTTRNALTLIRANVLINDLRQPVARLQHALTSERAQVIVYETRPTAEAFAALQRQEASTDRAIASFTSVAESSAISGSASAGAARAIAGLRQGLGGLPQLRARITDRSITGQQVFIAYNDLVAASYQILEQSVIQEGQATQVLPAIAVIELAISNEYLRQESALLDGNFAANAFPARDHQAFVSLVGAHRLLYAQSYLYLNPLDRAALNRDVSPRVAHALMALENRLTASSATPDSAPHVRQRTWDRTVAALSAGTQQAVQRAEARLVRQVRAQASARLHNLYLDGGLGLAAVIISLILSLWIAVRLARQLRGLRDSALELANVRLPDVVRRLRAGEDVDPAAQVAELEPGADEIGQVKAAFNNAQRTAVQSAVDEARVRRGINDVFRNLARRNQTLLERQMALLDALELRASEPGDLEGLFRIDHLTTRMRRHAESLLVLAGDTPRRTFREPVPFVDVLRAAATEVEDYTRVKVISRTDHALTGTAVADVIHMLAELVENATIFSPSDTEVRIVGGLVAKGFAIDIEDRGPGMSGAELASFNARLEEPPLFDLSGSDRLGIFVAGRLAQRHGIAVTLRQSPYGGINAIVLIPPDLVVPGSALGQGTRPDDYAIAAGRHALATRPAPAPVTPAPVTPAPVTPAPVTPAPVRPAPNGMPRRVRQASLAPQLRDTAVAPPGNSAVPGSPSPDRARTALSAFRRGWQQGISESNPGQGLDAFPPDDSRSQR